MFLTYGFFSKERRMDICVFPYEKGRLKDQSSDYAFYRLRRSARCWRIQMYV